MANELIPRQQAVYPSNDMQITQSPLMVGAYAKSGALAFSSGKETPQGIMSDTMYSVPMKGTRPFCSYLDVVNNPERGTEFAGMLSGPSAPSSTFEFGN